MAKAKSAARTKVKTAGTTSKVVPAKTSRASAAAPSKRAAGKPVPDDAPIVPFASRRAWGAWLAKNHATSRGVWLQAAKKDSGIASITYPEAVEEALCWGWIDGQRRSHDATWYLQKFTPRRSRSIWSKINRDKALELIASGAMKPSGLAEVERAKADGRWDAAYAAPSKATVPDDLAAAFAASPRAAAFFETLDARNRFAVLFRIHNAKKPETRARRVATFVSMLARGEKIHP